MLPVKTSFVAFSKTVMLAFILIGIPGLHAQVTSSGVTLTPLNAFLVDASRSVDHTTPARITFVNQSGAAVDIYWITYDGKRTLYRDRLAPGASWTAGTFLTHPWLVVGSGTGGTLERNTGVRLAGFAAITPYADTALITGVPGTGMPRHARRRQSDEDAIRALVKTFADARNARDGQAAAALYAEDGEYLQAIGPSVRGRTSLAEVWGAGTGQVQRTVSSIEFPSANLAVVQVATQFDDGRGLHFEVLILVLDGGKWSIRLHQTVA